MLHRYAHVERLSTPDRVRLGLIVALVYFHLAAEPVQAMGARRTRPADVPLDLSQDRTYRDGPWVYEYSISLKGTRSEGRHGKLLYDGREVPEPAHLNDCYVSPWGRLYWVGRPAVLFGGHGWMPKPLEREPIGQALADPSTLVGQAFAVRVKVLTSEELGTPDRIETEPEVLAAIERFGLKEAHVQRNWFRLAKTWGTLHNTKRWGHLELRLAASEPNRPLALEFRSTGDFAVTTEAARSRLDALLAPPAGRAASTFADLPPQSGVVCVVKCSLTPVIGDALDLFLVCQIEGSMPAAGKTLTLGPDVNRKTVTLKDIETVVVQLPGNATTGFAWALISTQGEAVRPVGEVQYVEGRPEGPPRVGAPGLFRATFRVTGEGVARISMAYRRPWETDRPADQSFEVTLHVESTAGPTPSAAPAGTPQMNPVHPDSHR